MQTYSRYHLKVANDQLSLNQPHTVGKVSDTDIEMLYYPVDTPPPTGCTNCCRKTSQCYASLPVYGIYTHPFRM